jgi:hypothetical protein
MHLSSFEQIKTLAAEASPGLWAEAQEVFSAPKIYLHWTMKPYDVLDDIYDVNIDKNGEVYISDDAFSTGKWSIIHRSKGSVSIAVCCAEGATPENIGKYPPTYEQLDGIARAAAIIAKALGIPVCKEYILTHGEAAAGEDNGFLHSHYALWDHDLAINEGLVWDLEYFGSNEVAEYNPRGAMRGGDALRERIQWFSNGEVAE